MDRCDRCGAHAYVRVELATGGELLFCGHHAREHAARLSEIASAIHDSTGALAGALPAGEDPESHDSSQDRPAASDQPH